ncbi:PhoX family protein [Sinosporangium siamense]|uniref:DUF839 domain-containing protein n=1 Tax=Sinosporangium siamense TaxID=1367973 RepID=A0A919RBC8_9ACTN|nr:alkaline phosphatase PhoX [Sinosporangium siamense]GII90816.1 hypothetical protein Ssi02_10470 [Sinosporangium siamense]
MDRRLFLTGGAAVTVASLAGPFAGAARASVTGEPRRARAYGRLRPMLDEADGAVRLHLPPGFKYRSFSATGENFRNGTRVPARHDGMAAFRGPRGSVYLIRNHEVNDAAGAFGDPATAYDPAAGGGTSTVRVSLRGQVLDSAPSLNGTLNNCSGGAMPWGSWISCEETVNGPDVGNDYSGGDNSRLQRKHGYIFEVPLNRRATARPIRSAGRFSHESVAFDPAGTGKLYLTEDNFVAPSGFYRYIPPRDPRRGGHLADGGRLQMLAVAGEPRKDLSAGQPRGAAYTVEWVDIDAPDPDFAAGLDNDSAARAVGDQGRAKGAALFSRLEGAVYHHGVIYFTSTQGGATAPGDTPPGGFGKGRGQVWAYETWSRKLRLVYESPGSRFLDLPDNITTSPRGTLVICEDGGGENYMRGLTKQGEIFDFAMLVRPDGDSGAEFAGSTFAPGGQTLFVNIQSTQGRTFAIWGPWQRGGF